jgi:hypothetical protein
MRGTSLLAMLAALLLPRFSRTARAEDLAHCDARFDFTANARLDDVAPLFGADRERVWAPGWDPRFVHPAPAADIRGMVFTVRRGSIDAVWVNTQYDPRNGVFQYVYVVPARMTALITIRLEPRDQRTHVVVEYERTALRAEENGRVRQLSERDRAAGPEWESQINRHLGHQR